MICGMACCQKKIYEELKKVKVKVEGHSNFISGVVTCTCNPANYNAAGHCLNERKQE